MRVHLVTSVAHAGLAPDDRHLLRALLHRGVDAQPVVWEDPLVDWAAAPVAVIRSTWDYTFRRGQYLAWAERAARDTQLLNPLEAVRWSTHKSYLLDLAKAGVPIVPTTLVTQGSAFDLAGHVDDRGWPEIVVKPAVGASGQWAGRFQIDDVASAQLHLDRLLGEGDTLIQPLLPSISDEGELSVVWLDGRVCFGVRKRGAPGEFRVHNDYGGSELREEPDEEAVGIAEAAIAATISRAELLYARIDLVRGLDGALCVMEHELVEPELFFGLSHEGTEVMAAAIQRRLADA